MKSFLKVFACLTALIALLDAADVIRYKTFPIASAVEIPSDVTLVNLSGVTPSVKRFG
ncbi:MAG: hypothetical protein LBT96_01795 [Campylobacteraceae bacterium]|jgi:hypothetical protein|nr:hypothetical protein [Campylobacteraceae bacterium]